MISNTIIPLSESALGTDYSPVTRTCLWTYWSLPGKETHTKQRSSINYAIFRCVQMKTGRYELRAPVDW